MARFWILVSSYALGILAITILTNKTTTKPKEEVTAMPSLRSKNNLIPTFHGLVDQRWRSVEEYTNPRSHPALESCLSHSLASGLPDYGVSPAQGKFLALYCRTASVTNVLEIGTLGGYSAIWFALLNPGLRVTSIEYNKHHAQVARENIRSAGLQERIEVLTGSALSVLRKLHREVEEGKRERFGFVFIDADKKNNWKYFEMAMGMMKPNSVICVDNIVREGALADSRDDDPDVLGSREVVEKAEKLEGVESVVMQTVGEKGYDGFLWAVIE